MPAVSQDKEDSQSLSEEELECHPCIAWSGISRKIPVLLFHAEAIVSKEETICSIGERYNLAFKIVRTESRLVRSILVNHGFHEVHPNSNDFNLMWTGSHLKTYLLRSLQDFQKVNHFPRSNELTRKDRLYKNIQRMQQAHGFQNFHIVPQTFVLPAEYQEFCNAFCKDKGPWIIKPVASSRGRGIYLVSSPSQISLDENILVSRYIGNPLLIDDFKFDVRLYVLVTSYDPVIIYVYEEGLTRFATVKYDHAVKNIKNQFMHLTNYSVNKKSSDYVSCDDPEVEDYGNKWSMSAMLRYLKQEGKDTTLLMGQIEDLIIKAVLSAELQIATACKMFVPHRNNCFELYGFDVLIDSNLKPWLLEVNLSPSLACDTPLDLKIKASMISDMFSLVGFVCQDPLLKQMRSEKAGFDPAVKNQKTQHHFFAQAASAKSRVRPQSANNIEELKEKQGGRHVDTLGLTAEELKVLRRTQEEHERRGGFIRIFPTPQTWELYSCYLEYKTSMNSMLANKLFHGRSEKSSMTTQFRNRLKGNMPLEEEAYKTCHVVQYESKLLSLEARRHRKRHTTSRATPCKRKTGQRPLPSLAHSSENEEADEREERGPQGKQEHTMSLAHTDPQPTLLERHRTEEHFPARVSKPKVDLLHILQQGWDLSKVQARMAFSSYLHRVQMRLLVESRTNSTPDWEQKDNDQMELVMRFLMRAASNLQQGMQVVLPSRQLSLPDRRRILAHQLGGFIHCYNKETEQMAKGLEKTEDEDRCISSNVFREFILEASESDLEDVLTFYTHKNKSASVFLGSSRRDRNKECSNSSGEPAKHHSRRNLLNAKEGSSASGLSLTAKADSPKNTEIQESVTRPGYNKSSITVNMNSHMNSKASTSRPASAGMFKEPDSLSAQAQSNQQAIVAALKKLVEKQAARQYSTSSHISLLTQHLTNLNLAKGVFSRGAQSVTSGARPDTATTRHSGMNLSGAVSHRKDAGDGKCRSACNLSTGVTLQPTSGSYQLQFAIQQLQQQKLQSRKLLDQSRSRHQAMLDGHTLVPGAVPRIPVPASCSVQVDSQSQTGMKQTASWRDSCHPEPLVPTRGASTLIPKPPSSTPKDTLSRKSATQRTNQQAPYEAPSGNGLSSRQNVVYDTTCGKSGLSVYSKLFDAHRSRPR
ncbi:hypothetical protein PDJAM_G00015270 [Pangasius djambal]|uniref:Uncharacterized protein n=1 Tax=Pangasius djambal TaxID=1691987 RepID=A0ACC5YM36_9TELE|nr:hypothetical protein [Pangasius djambal]